MDDSLLFRDITGQTTESEHRAIEAWRRASRAHDARYAELQALLQVTQRAPAPGRPVPSSPPDVLEVLQVAAGRAHASRRRLRSKLLGGMAAAALLAVAVGSVWRSRGAARTEAFGFEEMVTGENQVVTVALRDGSVMRLAPKSQARIRVREGVREVQLIGRAFFSVAKRDGLPFMVHTAGGDLTVLGTQFDVDARDRDVRLVVVEGKVALAGARGGETRVGRGEEGRVVEGHVLPTVVSVPAARDSTRWVGRFLTFQNTPLPEVAYEIGQAYGVRVTLADSTLAGQTITNWFSDRPLDEVVRAVCSILAAECAVQGTQVTIGRSPP
jgi:ferric-dicitrate binding protein FerR (iron transport regulator)